MARRLLLAALLLAALTASVGADSWMPFRDFRTVSPKGKVYAVVRNTGGEVSVELVRRREGAPPMGPAFAPDKYGAREGEGGPIDRDPEDRLIATATLPQLPLMTRVTDDPPGVLFFESYGNVGHEDSVTYIDARGRTAFARTLDDLREHLENSEFESSISSIWWFRGFTVVESLGSVLVVSAHGELLQIRLGDGDVTPAAPEVLLAGLRQGTEEERELCLSVAAELKPEGLRAEAYALAADASQSTGLRLRAAVAAKRSGGEAVLADLFLKSVEKGVPGKVRKYAAGQLAFMLGEAAIPVLRRLMRGPADNDVWHPAQMSFVQLGEKAVSTLCEMLLEEGESNDSRGGAAHALGKIRSGKSADALLTAVATAPDYVANAAANAVIAIAPPGLGERFAAILAKGATQDSRIAMYFRDHPAEYAREPLVKALARAEPGSFDAEAIQEALAALD